MPIESFGPCRGAFCLACRCSPARHSRRPRRPTCPIRRSSTPSRRPNFVCISDIMEYKALPEYHEPQWVTDQFVKTGKLPAVEGPPAQGAAGLQDRQRARRHRRLRRRDAPRHRRPAAGLELRRRPDPGLGRHRHRHVRVPDPHRPAVRGQGRRARADAQPRQELGLVGRRPHPDHAPDRRRQVVRRRAVQRRRRDVLLGRQHQGSERQAAQLGAVPTASASARRSRRSTTTPSSGPSRTPFPKQYLYTMAYGGFCPLPAHILKPQHPKYSKNTYDQYQNAFPPNFLNFPVMGAWVPVEYRPDDIVVLRRNPYYWKVDEAGNQLPYLDELELQALDLGGSRRAGRGRHRRLLQPRAGRKLRRSPEAFGRPGGSGASRLRCPHHRLLDLHEPARPMAGASPTRAPRPSATSTATSTSAWRSPRRSTGSTSATRWSRGRSPPSIRAASMPARRSTTRRRRSTIRSTSMPPRPSSPRPASRTPTATASSTSRPTRRRGRPGRLDHAARQRRLPDRQEPGRRRGRRDGGDRHPRDRQRASAAPT